MGADIEATFENYKATFESLELEAVLPLFDSPLVLVSSHEANELPACQPPPHPRLTVCLGLPYSERLVGEREGVQWRGKTSGFASNRRPRSKN